MSDVRSPVPAFEGTRGGLPCGQGDAEAHLPARPRADAHSPEINVSLLLHFHAAAYELADVERAALLNRNLAKVETALKRVLADLSQGVWKHDFLDAASSETASSDLLNALWNFSKS